MSHVSIRRFLEGATYFITKRNVAALHIKTALYNSSPESHEEYLPYEWYEKVFPKITKMTQLLKNIDLVDGRLVNIQHDSVIINDRIEHKMRTFKTLVRVFIGCPSVQQQIHKNAKCHQNPVVCFGKPSEREPMIVNSLTKISNFLNVSAQQRKLVRLTICPQVTQHKIFTGALEEILNGLKLEIDLLNDQCPTSGTKMGQQIVSSCLNLLANANSSYDPDSTSWMRLSPGKHVIDSPDKWEDVLQMFNDLLRCLENEKELLYHISRIEVMKEGVAQIRDVLLEKNIGYKEVRHQENLVQKKLSKTLGHSSQCLFTLLLYYLYGQVRDIEVDLCGGVYEIGGKKSVLLCMGRILTSDEEKMVWNGIKQLDRALRVFKFIWETAEREGVLELEGHLWCVGAKERSLTYRGNAFFLHDISL